MVFRGGNLLDHAQLASGSPSANAPGQDYPQKSPGDAQYVRQRTEPAVCKADIRTNARRSAFCIHCNLVGSGARRLTRIQHDGSGDFRPVQL
jgi:hypothetical protein